MLCLTTCVPDVLVVIPSWLLSGGVQHSSGQSLSCGMVLQLLQSFFDRLPDHQTNIERGSTHPTLLEIEVDHFSKVLQTHLVDVTSDPVLMLDFRCEIKNVPTIDLRRGEALLCYPPLKGNIADNPEDDLEVPTTALGHLSHQQTVHDGSFLSVAPSQTGSGAAPATSSASALRIIPTASLATDKQEFSPQSIDRLKALMLKKNRTQTLIKVGTEEASTHFDAHTPQDEASYNGDVSNADEEDIEVVPDEVDNTQIKGLKPAEAGTVTDKEVPKATNKEDGSQTSKSVDNKPVQNAATGLHLDLEMAQSAMISPFTAFRGQAECFS